MHLEELQIKGFRCLSDLTLHFNKGINILIGENDTGKTAILDALRICLSLGSDRREVYLTLDDFHVDCSGHVQDAIEFHLTFSGLTTREQGIFIEALAIGEDGQPELQIHVRCSYDAAKDRIYREYWGGEKEGQNIPILVLELIYFIHLGALRDAARDLTPGRGNRLSRLFLKLVPNQADQKLYETELNTRIRSVPRLNALLGDGKQKINTHLEKVSFKNTSQSVDIDFVDKKFRDIVESLKLQIPAQPKQQATEEPDTGSIDQRQTFKIWQNGLGSNNLIYIATVLGDLFEKRKREPDSFISLLIEEPEAHLHPQLQNLLFTYLQEIETHNIQVFVTSHSPTITAKTSLDSLIVLNRSEDSIASTPLQIIEINQEHKKYLHRFLDVTKCQLFFAKAAILVEGISEALLVPCLARHMGQDYNLERAGVEIVNVGGTSFEPFARLFNSVDVNKRLNVRCAIITDDDSNAMSEDSGEISSRAVRALKLRGGLLASPFLARVTLEYELYLSNPDLILHTYRELHPRTNLKFDGKIDEQAKQFADKVKANADKAVFAQLLAQKIDDDTDYKGFIVPEYIQNAIKWAAQGDAKNSH